MKSWSSFRKKKKSRIEHITIAGNFNARIANRPIPVSIGTEGEAGFCL
jgi:hypothetical protein